MEKIRLTWYGRCCFLIEINNKKILIDPYDLFDDIDVGNIDADYTLISSTWHDHGNIGASPKSIIISEPGEIKIDDIIITGVETKETRWTKNVVFNIKTNDFSITNFADLGDPKSLNNLTLKDKNILETTNIAFVRPNQIWHEDGVTSGELALRLCNPQIIIPHHFYPENFINRVASPKKILGYLPQVENMIKRIVYKKQQLNNYMVEIDINDYKEKTAIVFSDIHPQVSYKIS